MIAALGRLKDSAAVQPVEAALKSAVPAVRLAAAAALVSITEGKSDRDKRDASHALRPLLADPAAQVRNRAILAAAELGDRESIPALLVGAETAESRFETGLALAKLPDVARLAGLSPGPGRQES